MKSKQSKKSTEAEPRVPNAFLFGLLFNPEDKGDMFV
jgi:hypothetical protein